MHRSCVGNFDGEVTKVTQLRSDRFTPPCVHTQEERKSARGAGRRREKGERGLEKVFFAAVAAAPPSLPFSLPPLLGSTARYRLPELTFLIPFLGSSLVRQRLFPAESGKGEF